MAAIEPFLARLDEPSAMFLLRFPVPGMGMVLEPAFFFLAPLAQQRLRNGIAEAKADEIGGAGLFEVREVAAALLDFALRIEGAEIE